MSNLKIGAFILVGVIAVGSLSYGLWSLKRWSHYTFSYESQVRATVCEMVKEEHLKQPC